ncbi:unnamed protein product [Calypogeia fissa]
MQRWFLLWDLEYNVCSPPRPTKMVMSIVQKSLLFLLILSCSSLAFQGTKAAANQKSFTIDDDQFYKDGAPFRILGGSIHYFRIHPQYWEDRLLRAKALGLNVIQTYVPWNLHQPQEAQLNFEKNTFADLEGYLQLAQRLELLVMLRPGPYICGEWDFGGFPAWLLAVEPPLSLRSSDIKYLSLVDNWWDILLPKIFPYLYNEGGPIIMVQIENEYGSFGADKVYMEHLAAKARAHLGDAILYTTDGADMGTLLHGSLKGDNIYTSVDFPVEWSAAEAFRLQKLFNLPGKSPPMSSEFYTGWLTHWGEPLAKTDPGTVSAALERLLDLNASVVLYMAHGGTNFGFNSGANTGSTASEFQPDLTSYDYDAPIGEAGNCDSAKFKALRAVLSKHSSSVLPDPPPLPERKAYGIVELQKLPSLFDVLQSISTPQNGIKMDQPLSMELLGQASGFILYRSTLPAHTKPGSKLLISEVHDRAQVLVVPLLTITIEGGQATIPKSIYVGTLERWSSSSLKLPAAAAFPGSQLDILVENMGRVNYGPFMYDRKGITSGVFLDDIPVLGWTAYPIPLENIQDVASGLVRHQPNVQQSAALLELKRQPENWSTGGPSFYKGRLDVDKPADTFVSLKGWSKGVFFINGFNLGRYWPTKGPQCSLYVPAPLLVTGHNELLLLELESPQEENSVEFFEDPDYSCGL